MKRQLKVEILSISNYWDCPLKGMCSYNNKFYWYEIIDPTSKDKKYKVIEMKVWQITYELYWYSLFVNNVKVSTKFDKELINDRFKLIEDFYSIQKKEYKVIDYSKNKIIGYFSK